MVSQHQGANLSGDQCLNHFSEKIDNKMLSDLCPNCKYHTLYTTDDGQHMVCAKCRDVYDLTQGIITTVVLENKMKHLRNVMTNFFV